MENKKDITTIIAAYLSEFETENQDKLLDLLKENNEDDLFDRKNKEHITASALIINPIDRKILLIKHRTLGDYLQPGGHVEKSDNSILEAAKREALEETGMKPDQLVNFSIHFTESIPLDIDTHSIPENLSKHEPAHTHHDFRYLFFYSGEEQIKTMPKDSEIKWFTFSELVKRDTFRNLLEKIRKILSLEFKTKLYYDTAVNQFAEKKSSIQS